VQNTWKALLVASSS